MQGNYIDYNMLHSTINQVLAAYPVKRAAIFGSCARKEMDTESDVDLLVDFGESPTGLLFIDMKLRLEEELGRKVDVFTYNDVLYPIAGSAHVARNILSEAQTIYEKTN